MNFYKAIFYKNKLNLFSKFKENSYKQFKKINFQSKKNQMKEKNIFTSFQSF